MDQEQNKLKVKQLLKAGNIFQKTNNIEEKGNTNTIPHVVRKMKTRSTYCIDELKRVTKLSKEERKWPKAAGTQFLILFCQPKLHKTGMLLRPSNSTTVETVTTIFHENALQIY